VPKWSWRLRGPSGDNRRPIGVNRGEDEGLKEASGGWAEQLAGLDRGGRRGRLGGTITDEEDLEMGGTSGEAGDLELGGTSGDTGDLEPGVTSGDGRLWEIYSFKSLNNFTEARLSSPSAV